MIESKSGLVLRKTESCSQKREETTTGRKVKALSPRLVATERSSQFLRRASTGMRIILAPRGLDPGYLAGFSRQVDRRDSSPFQLVPNVRETATLYCISIDLPREFRNGALHSFCFTVSSDWNFFSC